MVSLSLSKFNNKNQFHKNAQKKWRLLVLFLIFNKGDVFASSGFFIKSSIQGMGHSRLMPFSSSYGLSRIYSSLSIAQRNMSDFNGPNNQESLLLEQTIKRAEMNIDKYEEFFKKCELFFKEVRTCVNTKRQNIQSLRAPKVNLNLALITPYSHENSSADAVFQDEDCSLASVQKKSQKLKVSAFKSFENPPLSDERAALYQEVSKKVKKMREDLMINIIENSRSTKKINQQQLISIVELYEAMIARPKNSISKVLNGVNDKGQGDVYKEILLHIKSRGSDLETYRKTCAKLTSDLGEEVSQAISRSVENVIKKRNMKKVNYSDLTMENCVFIVAEGSNPLYPVYPHEVESILVLYRSLTNRPKNSITKVLNSMITGSQSPIYKEIVDHITQKGSDLETYRSIYLRIARALNDNGMSVVYRAVDADAKIQDQEIQPVDQNPVLMDQETPHTSLPSYLKKSSHTDCVEQSLPDPQEEDIVSINDAVNDSIGDPVNDSVDVSLKGKHLEKDLKMPLSMTEQKRLNRVYGLLPEYHGKSVTGALIGKTVNKNLPIFQDIQEAIDQIREEAIKEGDNTIIDLDYFKRIILSSNGSTPVKVPVNLSCQDIQWTSDGKYSITKKEQERLIRIYNHLHQYHGKSITGVLAGLTTDKKLPIWKDILDVIDKIKEEAQKQGDTTVIDLKYFRKLYWSSMRVNGKSNLRDFIFKSS
ncbi:MAG: hypothetical protein CNLJKLNK_00501 [Holosporales bacterium]